MIDENTPLTRCIYCHDCTRHTRNGLPCCIACPMAQMSANAYQRLALRTEKTPPLLLHGVKTIGEVRVNMDSLLHAVFGMDTEQAELQDMIKKHLMYGKPFDPINVLEECGDQLWYIAVALSACGFTLQDCMEKNIEKLRRRFPDGFSEQKAVERDLDAERDALEGK